MGTVRTEQRQSALHIQLARDTCRAQLCCASPLPIPQTHQESSVLGHQGTLATANGHVRRTSSAWYFYRRRQAALVTDRPLAIRQQTRPACKKLWDLGAAFRGRLSCKSSRAVRTGSNPCCCDAAAAGLCLCAPCPDMPPAPATFSKSKSIAH